MSIPDNKVTFFLQKKMCVAVCFVLKNIYVSEMNSLTYAPSQQAPKPYRDKSEVHSICKSIF